MHRPATSSMILSSKNNKKGFFELSVTEQKHFDSDENTSFNGFDLCGLNDWNFVIGFHFV